MLMLNTLNSLAVGSDRGRAFGLTIWRKKTYLVTQNLSYWYQRRMELNTPPRYKTPKILLFLRLRSRD